MTKVALNKKLKVLVAEDDKRVLKQIRDGLVAIGFIKENITVCTDGADAWTKFSAEYGIGEPFELVLTDINMPHMNGIQLLKKIRQAGTTTPVIMITTENDSDTVIEAVTSGANNYIIKPFDKDTVKKRLLELFYPQKS